jgi:serine phosphatase RsbU (regulator of sigma subunit)
MGHARNALRAQLVSGNGPGGALTSVSTFLDWTHPLAHCTAVAATISPDTGTLRWSAAGHPPPLCVAGDGTARYLETPLAPPLGVKARRLPSYPDNTVVLDAESTVLLYTDGLIEGRGRGVDEGMEVLQKVASEIRPSQSLEDVADRILAGLVDHQDDDVCFVVFRWQPA